MSDLKDRVYLVTGASGAVGDPTVERLLAEGARVAAVALNMPQPRPEAGGKYIGIQANLTDEAAVERAFEQAESTFGPLWAVVHVAGAWKGGPHVADSHGDLLDAMLAVNLRTSYLVSRSAMRRFVPRGSGRITLTSSYAAATLQNVAGSGAYAISKAGVIALTKVLAEEGGPHGVYANCVAPLTIDTAANRQAMPKADPSRWVPVAAVVDALLSGTRPASEVNGAVLLLPGK
jgi:NAD(P)-dependent dehydrogenase (short-subunit alcohol dehydrogenase family)